MNRAILFATLSLAAMLVSAAVSGAAPRPTQARAASAEPPAFRIWRPTAQPRAGREYTGVVVTLFQEAEITMRPDSFRLRCGRASLTPRGKRKPVRYAPVRVLRLPDSGPIVNTGTPVIGIWVCTWTVPAGTAGWRMVGKYVATSIGRNPPTGAEIGPGSEGGPLYWTVRR